MKTVICIAGPTASGKSAFAVRLAKKCNGEIINADALQVYEQLKILSARPTEADMEGIAHHLYGFVSARTRYSTGKWLRDVTPVIQEVSGRGKIPILVGGTGLYFKALTDGLADIPEPVEAAQRYAREILEYHGIDKLRTEAEKLDPEATARVMGNDPQRLLRIVSVALGTIKSLSAWQADTHPVLAREQWKGFVLIPPREKLYERINARFDHMVENGGLDEARALLAMGLSPYLPAMKAIGVRELCAHLKGEMSLEEAMDLARQQTRRFAKRQLTWLRGNMKGWKTVSDPT